MNIKKQNFKLAALLILTSLTLQISTSAFSQAVGISGEYFVPDASSLLELKDTTKGFLMTRLTTTQRDNISSPAEGLIIFNTTTKCFEAYIETSWIAIGCATACEVPEAPTAATHIATDSSITWIWNPSNGAGGYKWNTINDYSTATDKGTDTSHTEQSLTADSSYIRYIWAYNDCGRSSSVTINESTLAESAGPGDTVFATSGTYSWTVPIGVTSVNIKVWGAGGGFGNSPGGGANTYSTGGGGGYAYSTIAVTPAENLTVIVGGGGEGAPYGHGSFGQGGYNGGGNGGSSAPFPAYGGHSGYDGAGGGGASEVKRTTTQLIVAGGGGGAGASAITTYLGGLGGPGGQTSASAGGNGQSGAENRYGIGGGATLGAAHGIGGAAGAGGSSSAGTNGSVGQGGTGGSSNAGGLWIQGGAAGGGGGGYYSGAGGGAAGSGDNQWASASAGAGGSGGSSYGDSVQSGSAAMPGNSGDPERGTSGEGGQQLSGLNGENGKDGKVIIIW